MVETAIEPQFRPIARVRLGGHAVPREVWARVRPKPGMLVEIVPVPEGGDGLRLVLTLAVVAVAIGATAGIGSFGIPALGLAAGGFGASFTASIVGAGISVAGMMAVNALVPPLLPTAQKQSSQTYSIGPGQNSARLREPVKKILGRHRVTLDLAAPWYTEQRGDDQILHGLLDVGLAPLIVAEPKLGDKLFDQYDQLDYEILDGVDGGVVQTSTLYPGNVVQDKVGADLTKQFGEVTWPTRDETDSWQADITFPQGLQHGHGDGSVDNQTVTFEVRYRLSAHDNVPAGGWSSPVQYTITAKSNIPIRRCLPPDGPGDFPTRGKYDLGFTRLTDDHANGRILDASTWESLRSINNDPAVTLPGVVRMAIRVRANRQISGQPPPVNVVATSVCRAWDAGAGRWVTDTVNGTRAPGALFREVLQGPGQPLPWADDQLNLAAIEDWSEWCDAQGFTCDYVVDTDIATLDLLKIVAGTGRAGPMQPDGIWSLAVDRPKAAPVQVLTPRNSSGGKWRRIFTEVPHALRVLFVDSTQGYLVGAERIVYDDGYSERNATKFLDWQLPGVVDPDLIHRHGRKHLAEFRLRPETWERDVGWEGLVCTRGDWVKAADDTIESGYVSARITLVESNGGLATAITVDDAVVLDGATRVGLAVRLRDVSLWTAPLASYSGERYRLALESPVPLAAAGPRVGDLAVIGVRGSETDDLLVIDIRRGPNHTATIIGVPLAPAVHTAENGPIPAWAPVLAVPAGSVAPIIWAIASDDAVLARDADGAYHVSMVVAFYRDGSSQLEKYTALRVEWQEVGTGHPARSQEWPADVQTARIHDVILGETYEVRACYRLRPDLVARGHPTYGPWGGTVTHFLDGPQLPPPDVGVPYLAGDRVVWSYPTPPPDFAGFVVRLATTAGQDWAAAQDLTDGLYTTAYILLAEIPVSAVELLVRAQDVTGNLSLGTARLTVVGVPRPKVVTISSLDYGALGYPGTIVGGEVTGGGGGTPVLTVTAGPVDPSPSPAGPVTANAVVAASLSGTADAIAHWTLTGLASADMADGQLAGTVDVLAGERSAVLPLVFAAQTLAADKTASLAITAVSGCTVGPPSSVAFTLRATVGPGLPLASLQAGPADVTPATGSVVHATATVGLSFVGTAPAVVSWSLAGLASGDMVGGALTGSVTVPAGSPGAPIDLAFAAQSLAVDKAATLTIAAVSGCILDPALSTVAFSLLHNSVATPRLVSVASGFGAVAVSVSATVHDVARIVLDSPASTAATVGWAITGLASGDVVGGALTGSFVIGVGSSSFDLDIAFAAQSLSVDKNATLTISAVANCALGIPSSVGFTLASNSAPVGWPYPQSTTITGISFDWTRFSSVAAGSDNWVSTWDQYDRALATWGDGNGFGGGRVAFGLARITGSAAGSLGGFNLLGGGNGTIAACFPNPTGSGYPNDANAGGPCFGTGLNGKCYGMIALGSRLYAWVLPRHTPADSNEAKLFTANLGALGTWSAAGWELTNSTGLIGHHPTFMQAGKDYADRFDGFFYTPYLGWNPDLPQPAPTQMQPGNLFLMRCPITANPMVQANWTWFTGTAAAPTWGAYANRKASWRDPGLTGWACSMFYSKPLNRCILSIGFGDLNSGQVGFYEAPRPWGPWRTIDRVLLADPSDRFDPTVFIASALTRGLSADGKSFPLVMSGSGTADALVAVQATLSP